MDKSVILTENLTWLSTLSTNPYVNTGNADFPTNYFGFFNVNFTTNEEKISPNNSSSKYIMKHIGLESLFVAGVAQGEFMKEVLKIMYMLLTNPQSGKDTLNRLKIGRAVTNLFIISNAFPIACRIVLKEKERLDDQGLLPIDYFGIKSINSLFFPKKVPHHFEYSFEDKIYRNLAKYTLQ